MFSRTQGLVAAVARQPILDGHQRVCAYELLYRASVESRGYDGVGAGSATRALLSSSLLTIGLDTLTGGKPAFVNFPRELIVSEAAELAPPEHVVIEILETVAPDAEVVAACRRLKKLGYQLALDDFTSRPGYEKLLDLADIVKVDFRETTPEVQRDLVKLTEGRNRLALLAEKVESYEEFRRAREWGYRYFQGYFFARPTITGGKRPPAFKLNYERLLVQVFRPDVDLDRVALIIKQELSLSYALLRYINSASFGWARRIESIQHALLLLGEQELRKWATLAIVSAACTGKPSELVVLSMVRARFCENLAKAARLPSSSEPFMTGLLSLLDAIVDTPLDEVLRTLTPSARMKAVLLSPLDETEPLSAVYHTVRAYEHADWPAVTGLSGRLGVDEAEVAQAYGEAVAWADGIFNAVRDRAA